MKVECIGFDSGWGCADFGCEDGPRALRADQIMARLEKQGVETLWTGPLGLKFLGNHAQLDTKEKTLPIVRQALRRLAMRVSKAVVEQRVPIVFGGDHSSAIGTWSGVISATESFENFGLIWIDAHLDAHTDKTSHEGKWGGWWHGQPVTALHGHGLGAFRNLCSTRTKLNPAHVSMIGPYSVEPAEVAYAKKQGIRVYYLDEVEKRGFDVVFAEALRRATTGTKGFGLSVDLDAFRMRDAPGVGTAEPGGIVADEAIDIMKSVGRHKLFRALEIAEFNPHNDIDHKTARLIEKLVENIFMNPAA